jgi:dCTP deaminase
MILKSDQIADLLEGGKPVGDPLVITPFPNLEQFRTSGSGSIDLRLGCWFSSLRQGRTPFLDVGSKDSGHQKAEALTKLQYVRFGEKFVLHPRAFVLGSTLEWIRLPKKHAGYVTSRSSWGRRGLIIATATGVHPGFTGCLTLELFNSGEVPIALYPGMAISQLFLHTVSSKSKTSAQSTLACRRRPFLGSIQLDDFAEKLKLSRD